jgi:hypothetical protein
MEAERARQRYIAEHQDPDKRSAWEAVREALRTRRLRRQRCKNLFPGCVGWPTQAHHHLGYAPEHRLDVEWLCVPCHNYLKTEQRSKQSIAEADEALDRVLRHRGVKVIE